jgi:hypothetical protein
MNVFICFYFFLIIINPFYRGSLVIRCGWGAWGCSRGGGVQWAASTAAGEALTVRVVRGSATKSLVTERNGTNMPIFATKRINYVLEMHENKISGY